MTRDDLLIAKVREMRQLLTRQTLSACSITYSPPINMGVKAFLWRVFLLVSMNIIWFYAIVTNPPDFHMGVSNNVISGQTDACTSSLTWKTSAMAELVHNNAIQPILYICLVIYTSRWQRRAVAHKVTDPRLLIVSMSGLAENQITDL